MIFRTFYKANGEIVQSISGIRQEDIDINTPNGCESIDGIYSPQVYRIVNGAPVLLPVRPDYPAHFDYDTGEWVWDENRSWIDLRYKRDKMLAACDWTQVPDAPVDRQAWAEYRQALRDLPANTADPRDIDWPVQPQ